MFKDKIPSPLFILPAIIFTAFSSIIIKSVQAEPILIAFYRMFFSSFLVLPFTLRENRGKIPLLEKKELYLCLASGAFLALHFASWIASLSHTSVAASTILVSMCPLFVILYEAFFLRKRPEPKTLISFALALTGTVLIALDSYAAGSGIWGNFLALTGGMAVAGYLIIGEEAQKTVKIWLYVFYVYSIAAGFLGVFSLFKGASAFLLSGQNLALIFLMSILCSLLGHTIYNWMVGYHGAGIVSLAVLAEPVFASLLAIPFLKEYPGIFTVFGGLIILPAVGLSIRRKN
jgi:drug/metabolite transporter (DMT)-like permease